MSLLACQKTGTDRLNRLICRATKGESSQRAQRDAEPDEEDDEEGVDRDAEDFLHRLRHQDALHVGECDLIDLASRG